MSERATWHDEFARCVGCGHATVGHGQPYAIHHKAGCESTELAFLSDPYVLHVDEPTRDAIIEASLATVDWEAIRRGEADPEEAAAHALRASFEISRFPVSAEPSPNPLREALERIAAMCGRGSVAGQIAREALAADQSQGDRTSDEATPAEPACDLDEDDAERDEALLDKMDEIARRDGLDWDRHRGLIHERALDELEQRVPDEGRRE